MQKRSDSVPESPANTKEQSVSLAKEAVKTKLSEKAETERIKQEIRELAAKLEEVKKRASLIERASELSGRLMITHGSAEDEGVTVYYLPYEVSSKHHKVVAPTLTEALEEVVGILEENQRRLKRS